ncbi:MAG TPA: YbhB/YbcL family Raf kinase inhibitor-like protein [Steroidobacteraceae bacterium]
MLGKTSSARGRGGRGAGTGAEGLVVALTELTGVNASIEVRSPAFGHMEPIPVKYTADGEGISPPLEWRGVPMNAEGLVLLVEDPDAPTPEPFVHAIVWDLPGTDASLPEAALPSTKAPAPREALGRNSLQSATYTPPSPPRGHGTHRYVFQVFALDIALRFDSPPARAALLERIKGHVIAKGLLIGTYERA